jgi:hypothetical protein
MAGMVSLDTPSGTGQMEVALHWVKKPVPAASKDAFYRGGFDEAVDWVAAPYLAPAAGQPALGVLPGADNAVFSASGGNLATDPLEKLVTLDDANKLVAPQDADGVKLTLNVKTGLFASSFLHGATGKAAKGSGVLLQSEDRIGGLFFGTDRTGTLSVEPR